MVHVAPADRVAVGRVAAMAASAARRDLAVALVAAAMAVSGPLAGLAAATAGHRAVAALAGRVAAPAGRVVKVAGAPVGRAAIAAASGDRHPAAKPIAAGSSHSGPVVTLARDQQTAT